MKGRPNDKHKIVVKMKGRNKGAEFGIPNLRVTGLGWVGWSGSISVPEEDMSSHTAQLQPQTDSKEQDGDDVEQEFEEPSPKAEKWKNHYSSNHRILLVGEGDFSFSLSLAKAFGSAHNMVATCLDSKENIVKKFCHGLSNVMDLQERGCLVLYGVDAKEMGHHYFLKTQRFDRIVYNFPHVGFLYPENSNCQIQLNKRLVKGFLANAKILLRKEGGEIHITHKEGDPYNKWDLVEKAEKRGLVLQQVVPFSKEDYPGYDNKRAHGKNSDASFSIGESNTYIFKLKDSL